MWVNLRILCHTGATFRSRYL